MKDAKKIFLEALDNASPDDLAAYLEKDCAEDASLRARVEELLRARKQAGRFLEGGSAPDTDARLGPDELPGGDIGPYKLLGQIGESNLPVRRRVALKQREQAMTRSFVAWSSLVIASLSAQAAGAAVMVGRAYEPFSYPSSPSPANRIVAANNLNGGWGWNAGGDILPNAPTSNWDNSTVLPAGTGSAAGRLVASPSLAYAATGYPASVGNKASLDGTGGNSVTHSIGQLIDSGTFYFSYLTKLNNSTMRTANLAFFGPANGIAGTPGNTPERFAVGQIGNATSSGTTSGNIGLLMNNANPTGVINAVSPIAYGASVPHLVVGRVDFNASGNDTVTLYIDPTDMTSEPATPYIQTSSFEVAPFNSFRMFAGAAATINGVLNPAPLVEFDEIRIGRSWSDMIATVPASPKYLFTTIDYPGATGSSVNNIGNSGKIVGEFEDGSGHHAFLLANGVYTSFDVPEAFGDSSANGVNSANQIVGWYKGFTNTKAYIRNGNTYTDLSATPTGSPETKAYAINDAGHVVGYYKDPANGLLHRGFFYNGSTYNAIHYEGAVGTEAFGVNNSDQVVGYYADGQRPHGFVYSAGAYTTVDHPLGTFGTVAQGINDAGTIAGIYFDEFNRDHGFVKTSTGFITVDYPGATLSGIAGINNAGQVVGYYQDATGFHGFLATPVADADFNSDGRVDGLDFASWKAGFGLTAGGSKPLGDANGDFAVDGADFLKWQTQLKFGGAVVPAKTAVPEPSALLIAVVSAVGLAIVGQRRGV